MSWPLPARAGRGLTSRKTVRQAVALALDPGLLRPALGQWAVPHAAWLPPGAWAVRDNGPLLFDAARARRLLAQVAPIDPSMTLLASDQVSGPEAAAITEAIRVSLGAPGFRVRRLLGTDGATPGTATNVAFFRSPLVDGMLTRAGQLGYRPERLRLYQRLQSLLADELPYVPLYVRVQWMVARPEVKGIRLDPGGLHRLERMMFEPPAPPPPPRAPLDPLTGLPIRP